MKPVGVTQLCFRCREVRSKHPLCAKCARLVRTDTKRRTNWDSYFMGIARQVATRGTCPRKQVGAVLVRAHTILSTGYNGSVRKMRHCTEVGCMMEDGHCVRTVHAEANAIIQAARNGVNIEGTVIYTTASPCWPCFKLIANAGVMGIVYGELYRDDRIHDFAQLARITLKHVEK